LGSSLACLVPQDCKPRDGPLDDPGGGGVGFLGSLASRPAHPFSASTDPVTYRAYDPEAPVPSGRLLQEEAP
jgi:hypothetical protein